MAWLAAQLGGIFDVLALRDSNHERSRATTEGRESNATPLF
jgi:hypothetical protein